MIRSTPAPKGIVYYSRTKLFFANNFDYFVFVKRGRRDRDEIVTCMQGSERVGSAKPWNLFPD